MATRPRPEPVRKSDFDRPLPHNLEAERSVLGAILLDNRALNAAVERLRTDDFFLPQHRHIFERMVELGESQQAIDLVTICEELTRTGNLEAAGGVAYVSQLADGMPRVANVEHYARIVKGKARLRNLAYKAEAVKQQALAAEDDAAIICDRALEEFGELRSDGERSASPIAVYTAAELVALAPEPVQFVAYPIAVRGMLSLLDGLAKSAGKTTLLFCAILAVLRGRTFLNRATKRVNVLLVTEENPRTLALALERVGLGAESGLYLCPWGGLAGMSWPALTLFLEKKCVELDIGWLAVDTFFAVAGLGGDAENDAGLVDAAVAPLKTIAGRLDIAVSATRHERKAGGQIGESGRGSTALSGAADVIVRLQRMAANYGPNVRRLEITGRIQPEKLAIELKDGNTYIAHAEDARISTEDEATAVAEAIATNTKATVRQLARDCGVGRNRVKKLAEQRGWILTDSGWELR